MYNFVAVFVRWSFLRVFFFTIVLDLIHSAIRLIYVSVLSKPVISGFYLLSGYIYYTDIDIHLFT